MKLRAVRVCEKEEIVGRAEHKERIFVQILKKMCRKKEFLIVRAISVKLLMSYGKNCVP